jgi:hypothetical protein
MGANFADVSKIVAVGILGPAAGYAGTLVKGWIEQSNVRDKRRYLCEEADRLIKFHATLSQATLPSLRVQSARTSIATELDNVLDELSRSLIEPPGSPGHPRSHMAVTIEKWLLLYRPRGFASWVLHSLFFMLVPVWCLFFYVGLVDDLRAHATDTGVGLVVLLLFLVPIVLCNYLARKVDDRGQQQPQAAQVTLARDSSNG